MKLTEITFQNQEASYTLGKFAPGVNFIYGARGAGKTQLCRFVRELIFGPNSLANPTLGSNGSPVPGGNIGFVDGDLEFQLRRRRLTDGRLEIVDSQGSSIVDSTELPSAAWMFERLDSSGLSTAVEFVNPQTYDLLFNFSLSETPENLPQLYRFLRDRLNVPVGESGMGDGTVYQTVQRSSQQRTYRLIELSKLIDQVKSRRQSIIVGQNQDLANEQSRLRQIDLELQQLVSQTSEAEVTVKRSRSIELDAEISGLKASIDAIVHRDKMQSSQALPEKYVELQSILYHRLDEIDQQLHHWRLVQARVQARRVKLKEEMDEWNELKLNSPNHPYFNAQKLLTSIEHRVNQNDQLARQWELNPAHHTDPGTTVRNIQTLCQSMRDDLLNLGQELGLQFKHLRHRAAAIELKHLREVFEEIAEYIDRLTRTKDRAVTQLGQFDPTGADQVLRADRAYIDLVSKHGHLEARRRTLGNWPVAETISPATDVTPLRNRIKLLEEEREGIRRWQVEFETNRSGSQVRQSQLLEERNAIQIRLNSLKAPEVKQCDAQLATLTEEYETLLRSVDTDYSVMRTEAHPILKRASQLLHTGTGGQLQKIWLSTEPQQHSFVAVDYRGQTIPSIQLERYQQDLVYLSLAMAATEVLPGRAFDFPVLIDEAFANFSREKVPSLIALLDDLQRAGHQLLLLFTNHQYLADRIPGTPVFEIPVPAIVPTTSDRYTDIYRRTSSANKSLSSAVVDLETFAPNPAFDPPVFVSHRMIDDDFFDEIESGASAILNRPPAELYPLSKYVPVDTSLEDRDFIVSYPVRTEDVRHLGQAEDSRPIPFQREFRRSTQNRSAPRAAPVAVEAVGDALGFAPTVDDLTLLDSLELFHLEDLRKLGELEIESVQQLLALDPDELSNEIRERGFSADQVNRWQSIVWLLCNVPGMRTDDARVLVACGVTEPEHLATSQPQPLLERMERYLSSSRTSRLDSSNLRLSIARINGWMRALQSTRNRWYRAGGLSRLSKRHSFGNRHATGRRESEVSIHESKITRSQRTLNRPSGQREPMEIRPPRMRTPEPSKDVRPVHVNSSSLGKSKTKTNDSEKNRFFLELKDHIQAAPSIGPKTAERFERIGINTVAEFLNQTAESIAAKLKYRRITADIVRTWQNQTRLVCQIPNLRGHDAQLLVACDFVDPEKIAAMNPQKLLDIIRPFSQTKEGLKIIRTGREPDLEEIANWIRWASMTRSLHAA